MTGAVYSCKTRDRGEMRGGNEGHQQTLQERPGVK